MSDPTDTADLEDIAESTVTTPSGRQKVVRYPIRKYTTVVERIVQETHDTATLWLFSGDEKYEYRPGHFCTIDPHQFPELANIVGFLEDLKGKKEPKRAYSLYSHPLDPGVAITVKEEEYSSGSTKYPPILSPLLARAMRIGQRVEISGFAGPYHLPEDIEQTTDHLVHLVAGSGSVPNLSILRYLLKTESKIRHTFIYTNKTARDTIYREELDALAARHPDKVKMIHTLTREKDIDVTKVYGPNYVPGRISMDLLRNAVSDWKACHVFTCGPGITKWDKEAAKEKGVAPTPRFLETVLQLLAEIGVSKEQLHKEAYG